jgi:hypothetical protein
VGLIPPFFTFFFHWFIKNKLKIFSPLRHMCVWYEIPSPPPPTNPPTTLQKKTGPPLPGDGTSKKILTELFTKNPQDQIISEISSLPAFSACEEGISHTPPTNPLLEPGKKTGPSLPGDGTSKNFLVGLFNKSPQKQFFSNTDSLSEFSESEGSPQPSHKTK